MAIKISSFFFRLINVPFSLENLIEKRSKRNRTYPNIVTVLRNAEKIRILIMSQLNWDHFTRLLPLELLIYGEASQHIQVLSAISHLLYINEYKYQTGNMTLIFVGWPMHKRYPLRTANILEVCIYIYTICTCDHKLVIQNRSDLPRDHQ